MRTKVLRLVCQFRIFYVCIYNGKASNSHQTDREILTSAMGGLPRPCRGLYNFLFLFVSYLFSHATYCSSSSSSFSSSSSPRISLQEETFALLQFKNSLSFSEFSSCEGGYKKTSSWVGGTDCCSWDGVSCDPLTGHVIGLDLSCSWLSGTIRSNTTLFLLSHLQNLNLAFNNFRNSRIPPNLRQLVGLTHLNLSSSYFSGQVPSEISHLSRLVSLDLSSSYYDQLRLETTVLRGMVSNLTELKELFLDRVTMSLDALGPLANLPLSLTSLQLSNCELQGEFPAHIFQLPNLLHLGLSGNNDLTGTFPEFNQSSLLEFLDTSFTGFSGKLPASVGNLRFLKYLDLTGSGFSGELPASIGNLMSLRYLDLSFTKLGGPIPASLGNLSQLTYLRTRYSNFTGQIPSSFSKLKQVTFLDLSENKFSGQIPDDLTSLTQLSYLDLSKNQLVGPIPSHGNGLADLTFLSLSNNQLSGKIPSWLFSLPSLEQLDLSENQLMGPTDSSPSIGLPNLIYLYLYNNKLSGNIPSWLFSLPSLRHLDLRNNKFTGEISEFQPKALEYIYLRNNEIHGPIPESFSGLENLTGLTLSSYNLSGSADMNILSKLKHLGYLGLSNYNLSLGVNNSNEFPALELLSLSSCMIREFPSTNQTLLNVNSLVLSSCNITEFPSFLKNLKKLRVLDLSDNRIQGEIPRWLWETGDGLLSYLNVSHNSLTKVGGISGNNLEILDMGSNNLQGPLPLPPRSAWFIVSNNKLSGEIPSSICSSNFLSILDLSNNNFTGMIPGCLFSSFSNGLLMLSMRMNNLQGVIPEVFAKGNRLMTLDLNGNQLQGPIPRSLVNCTGLQVLDLGNNNINDTFPHWLETLPSLQVLILRSNSLYGHVEDLKARTPFSSLKIIDLSHNNFTGHFPTEYFTNLKSMTVVQDGSKLQDLSQGYYENSVITGLDGAGHISTITILITFTVIDLSHNKFQGPIPILPPTTAFYSISTNAFTGEIPSLICNMSSLIVLDLSTNILSGTIPMCLGNLSNLSVVNLRENGLQGTVPDTFILENSLRSLDLNGNKLSGKVPGSLLNCKKLEVLDLGNNEINDTFPNWLGSLPELQVLVIRSNRLHGLTDDLKSDLSFSKLRIIDIAFNDFNGNLGNFFFENLRSIMVVDAAEFGPVYMGDGYYQDSVMVTMKGIEVELVKILTIFTAIDFSSNNFQGQLPENIGALKALRGLNFSSNSFSGKIPPSIGSLHNLEWLDLSINMLTGEIPTPLTDLTSLAVLNVSYNQLVGPIPRGNQFNTFPINSYTGNLGLCGFPLSRSCTNGTPPPGANENDESEFRSGFGWKPVLMGYGCGTIFGLFTGYIVFQTGKPKWFLRIVGGGQHQQIKTSRNNTRRRSGRQR